MRYLALALISIASIVASMVALIIQGNIWVMLAYMMLTFVTWAVCCGEPGRNNQAYYDELKNDLESLRDYLSENEQGNKAQH